MKPDHIKFFILIYYSSIGKQAVFVYAIHARRFISCLRPFDEARTHDWSITSQARLYPLRDADST